MAASFDFLTTTDKPALLALSTPEWQELARAALDELGYKSHLAAAHSDFITSFTQVPYQVIIIEECFAADTAPENRSLVFLQAAQMQLRRHAVVILVGDSFTEVTSGLKEGDLVMLAPPRARGGGFGPP